MEAELHGTPAQLSHHVDETTRFQEIAQENGLDPTLQWLNTKTMNKINSDQRGKKITMNGNLYLTIQLPNFELPIIFLEKVEKKKLTNQNSVPKKWFEIKNDPEWVHDPEHGLENPSESKNLQLSKKMNFHSKPTSLEEKEISKMISISSLHELSKKEKEFFWKYRTWLCDREKFALPKFLRIVDWSNIKEKQEAIKLMEKWTPIDTVTALDLLSDSFKENSIVRNFAVKILKNATENELLNILLQLVQALQYEKDMRICFLSEFLIERANSSFLVAHYFFWYLQVEIDDTDRGFLYKTLQTRFLTHISKNSFFEKLTNQLYFFQFLNKLCLDIKKTIFDRKIKTEEFKKALLVKFSDLKPLSLTLPISPNLEILGIDISGTSVLKSSTSPLKLSFKTISGPYHLIFKTSDDLRQDQLVIQMIRLMDKLLKDNGLDLKLSPYNVLACSPDAGFIEMVFPSFSIKNITNDQGLDIRTWLSKQLKENFDESCENFIKSCAGYCVVSYILGIGDRHLDNLMLTPDGRLFHIDFGFILGNDPKPLPPPMKISAEMIIGMGGPLSKGYTKFLSLCCQAYNVLRKHSRLIISLFVLMTDAKIRDINGVIGSDPKKNLMKLEEKFRLDLDDGSANQFMQDKISESKNALFPKIMEEMHRWAQYFN